jgi:hypothetical protein
MSKVKIIFESSDISGGNQEAEVFVNALNQVTVSIFDDNDEYPTRISLDKLTACRFVKHMKNVISQLEDEGGQNGN